MKLWKIMGTIFFVSFVASATFIAIKGFVGSNETTASNETAISNKAPASSQASISNETEPQKIARQMVKHEMSKDTGLKKWQITSNDIVSDKIVNNTGDYDKPLGEQRVVWVEGGVKFTTKNGTNANDSYNLELYQMKGDSKWYINNHWGVLRNLVVTEKPDMTNDGRVYSDSDKIELGEKGGLASTTITPNGNIPNPPKNPQQSTPQLDPNDEKGAYNAVVNYENARIKAINSGDFEIERPYLTPNGILPISDQQEINSLHSKGITVQWDFLNIESVKNAGENKFEVTVSEKMTLPNNETSQWIYTVEKSNGKYLLSNVREVK